MLHSQPMIQPTLALAAKADVTFVGIGDLGPKAPLYVDGFISEAELEGAAAGRRRRPKSSAGSSTATGG